MLVRFRVGAHVADLSSDTLESTAGRVKLERRTMATLAWLAARPGQVVSREEILDGVWPNVTVTDQSLATVISDLRKALGDDRRSPQYIETIAKRGYRLLAPVTPLAERPSGTAPVVKRAVATPRIASAAGAAFVLIILSLVWSAFQDGRAATAGIIAVGEFHNATGSSAADHVAFALGDVVSGTLAKATTEPVVRSNSGTNAADPDLRAFVTGRVVRDGEMVVAHVQVIRASDRDILWAESYVIGPGRLTSRSREIGRDVAASLGLSAPEMLQASEASAESVERYWRARFLWDRRDLHSIRLARQILEQLTREEPNFAAAHAALADIYAHKSGEELGIPRTNTFLEAQRLLDRANNLSGVTSETLVTQALLAFYRDRNIVGSRRIVERAIDANPDSAAAWQTLAMIESSAGDSAASIGAIEKARSINPGSGSIAWDRAWHMLLGGHLNAALAATRQVRELGESESLLVALIHDAGGRHQLALPIWRERAAQARARSTDLARVDAEPDTRRKYRLLAQAFTRPHGPPRHVIAAHLFVSAGDHASAKRELRLGADDRSDWMSHWALRMPQFAQLHRAKNTSLTKA